MESHHSKHHQAYVAGSNTAVGQLEGARANESFGALSTLEKNFAFHLGGPVNHSVQGAGWSVLSWDLLAGKPYIIQHFDHQGKMPVCMEPLLMLDMWERTPR